MALEPNGLRRKLRDGLAAGSVAGHHNPDMVDFLGQFGLDAVWLEAEHGPVSWEQIGDFSRACDLWGMASIVRVDANEPSVIGRALDRGASAVVVPHINTRSAAEQAARSARFSPVGARGMWPSRRSYGRDDYYRRANDEVVLVVLIEEIEAVRNLGEILKVDEVDVFHVAPNDLAQTMGHVGNAAHPEVQATIDRALAQIVAAGRTAGTSVNDENRERYMEMGVRFVNTHWTLWVAKAAQAYRESLAKYQRRPST